MYGSLGEFYEKSILVARNQGRTFHDGIDYVTPKGTSIVAANDGVVMVVGSL
ncbi:hypothetical protein EGH09_21295 [Brevibacillus laterosporus]|nr:hypothetical protein EGH09_21295 [Brevibacillus laterosporus]